MFRKLKAGLGGKGKAKFRLDVAVERVEGLPAGVSAARLQWARGAKVAVTKLVPASAGAVAWNEELSQIATLVRSGSGFEPKAYEFKLQAPDRTNAQKPPATIGKATLDFGKVAATPGMAQQIALPIPVPGGRATLHLLVGATEVNSMALDDDSMSVMTGASGLSSTGPSMVEQDLSGFRVESSRDMGAAAAATTATPASPVRTSAPSPLGGSTATSPRTSVQPSAAVSAEASLAAAAAASEAAHASSSGAEVETLRREVEARDAHLAALQQELEASQRQLAASSSSDAAAASAAVELQQQNASLEGEVAQLRSQLAAATAAAAAAATSAAVSTGGSGAEAALQEQLASSQARVAELEQQLAAGASGAASSEAAATAKLAMAEQKIEQLMVLVQQQGAPGGSGREAELEAELAGAKQDALEAEEMAQEAMTLLETAQAEIHTLQAAKAAAEQELAALQQQSSQATNKWKEEREAKKEADWDARLKEAYKRMEESVLLAERTQREKDELQERYAVLLSEKQAIEAKLDPDAVDQQVALEVDAARKAAEAQARIEVEALQQRLRTMEEYVEDADAKRLAAASKVAELEQQLAGVRRGEEDTYSQVRAAEERADGLSLELQYAQGEAVRLVAELELAREAAERRTGDHQRELADTSSRASLMQQQLEDARTQLRQEAAAAGELRSRVLALEEDLEASRLQLVAAQQSAALAAAAGAAGGAAIGASAEAEAQRRRLESQLTERQRAAEERAAQLDALGRELAGVRASLADEQAARQRVEGQLADAQHALAASTSKVAELEAALAARDTQLAAAQEAQRSSLLALMSARGRSTVGEESDAALAELRGQLESERQSHAAEVEALATQLSEAQALAGYSAGEMAELVQQLAEARAERGEAAAKLGEAREEVSRLRSGPDGELRARIERLEKDIVIQRNRADVNSLFKEEHDRIAQELVETKLVWAEAQEQIVKLKRSLVKAQEKNVKFSDRMTKMEAKMYAIGNGTAAGAKKLGQKLTMKGRSSSRDREGSDTSSAQPSPVI